MVITWLKKLILDLQKSHPGFAKVASGIAKKEGVSKQAASAILASATRKASPEAKKANPHLKAVKMAAPGKRRAYNDN
jgi:hypothetical protein